jgi:hypothetical protein
VNVEPLPDALTTVTSPRNMRASLRVIASPRPGLPKRRRGVGLGTFGARSFTASSWAPEVHEDQARLLGEHVAVDRRYLDAARPQSLDHRVHLVCGQHEIAGDGGLAAAGRLSTFFQSICWR